MKRVSIWIAAIACLIGPVGPALTQTDDTPDVYRVELIVVEHVGGLSDHRPAQVPLDFTATPDPLIAGARLEQATMLQQRALGPLVDDVEPSDARRHWLENEDERIEPAPTLWTAPDGPSDAMRQAWERLDRSEGFQPLSWTGWFQTAPPRRAGRSQRVHDNRVIESKIPAGATRPLMHPDLSFVDELWAPDMPPVLSQLFGSPHSSIQSRASALYRVDGAVSMRQRRFLHLDLNLVWQQRAEDPDALSKGQASILPITDSSELQLEPELEARPDLLSDSQPQAQLASQQTAPWELHRLRDARVIRPGRFEYFDSSRFGVLARVTRFEQKIVEPEPRPAPEPTPQQSTPAANPASITEAQASLRPDNVPDASGRYH